VNRFNPGQVVATPGALAALEASGESLFDYLTRHLSGDWGDVDAEDAQENELSLKHGWRLLSAYTLKSGTNLYLAVRRVLNPYTLPLLDTTRYRPIISTVVNIFQNDARRCRPLVWSLGLLMRVIAPMCSGTVI
jgi:hypothetical protein